MPKKNNIIMSAEGFELDMGDLSANFNLAANPDELEFDSRYIKPPYKPEIQEAMLVYKNAEKLAHDIKMTPGARYYIVVDGTFYFGDFIEALIVRNNWLIPEMTISTLSMNENNVDSLANLLKGDYVQKLNLVVSAYFYSHERAGMIPYIYDNLDIDNRFQLAAASSHCKLAMFETDSGLKITMHGSANLRSSSNIEQLMVEENPELYQFNKDIQDRIIETYKTINHQVRRNTLWQAVQNR